MKINIRIAKWFLCLKLRKISYYWKHSLQDLSCPRILRTTLVYSSSGQSAKRAKIKRGPNFPCIQYNNDNRNKYNDKQANGLYI